MLRGQSGHGRQDRPGARRPDDRERGTQQEARAEPVAARHPAARARREWLEQPAGPFGQGRHEQHQSGEGQEDDRDRVQQILRQAERREHARGGQGEDHERECQTESDAQRPATPARRPRREHDGHDRQHAGRQERGETGDHGRENEGHAHTHHARPSCALRLRRPRSLFGER